MPPRRRPENGKPFFVTRKTALKNLVLNPDVNDRLQDAVKRCHTIVVHTTLFVKVCKYIRKRNIYLTF